MRRPRTDKAKSTLLRSCHEAEESARCATVTDWPRKSPRGGGGGGRGNNRSRWTTHHAGSAASVFSPAHFALERDTNQWTRKFRTRRRLRARRHVGCVGLGYVPGASALIQKTNPRTLNCRTRWRLRARRHVGCADFAGRVATVRLPAELTSHTERNRMATRLPLAAPRRASLL